MSASASRGPRVRRRRRVDRRVGGQHPLRERLVELLGERAAWWRCRLWVAVEQRLGRARQLGQPERGELRLGDVRADVVLLALGQRRVGVIDHLVDHVVARHVRHDLFAGDERELLDRVLLLR